LARRRGTHRVYNHLGEHCAMNMIKAILYGILAVIVLSSLGFWGAILLLGAGAEIFLLLAIAVLIIYLIRTRELAR
jgi:hypothetical protein